MNFAINPIKSSNSFSAVSKTTSSMLEKYNQSQSDARVASVVVYQSLAYLTNSYDTGLTLNSLTNLRQTFENENLSTSPAYRLVDTMIDNFNDLSSDGESIYEKDLMSIVTFSAAQEFAQSGDYKELTSVLQQIGSNVSSAIAAQYGSGTALTLAFMDFMNNISQESLDELISNLNKTNNSDSNVRSSSNTSNGTSNNISKTSNYVSNPIQDYKTVSKSQLKTPINIAV